MTAGVRTLVPAALRLAVALPAAAQQRGLKLQLPSPDWRDQVIDVALTDRFDDGDAQTVPSVA